MIFEDSDMKTAALFVFILVLAAVWEPLNGDHVKVAVASLRKSALKRTARTALESMTWTFIDGVYLLIVQNCIENGQHNIKQKLEKTYIKLTKCIAKRKLYTDTEEDYVENVEKCSAEPISVVKECLSPEQAYYPDFMLNLAKSQIDLIYRNRNTIALYLTPCMAVFAKRTVQTSYMNCLKSSVNETENTQTIPPSVDILCRTIEPASKCFPDVITKECKKYSKLKKYAEEQQHSVLAPCNYSYGD